jgi:hypothetical protein
MTLWGICRVCDGAFAVKNDGTLRVHRNRYLPGDDACFGAGIEFTEFYDEVQVDSLAERIGVGRRQALAWLQRIRRSRLASDGT